MDFGDYVTFAMGGLAVWFFIKLSQVPMKTPEDTNPQRKYDRRWDWEEEE